MKSQKVGKHPSKCFFRETVQQTLKIQSTQTSVHLRRLQITLDDEIFTKGEYTKFVELSGRQKTLRLSGLENIPSNTKCVFTM